MHLIYTITVDPGILFFLSNYFFSKRDERISIILHYLCPELLIDSCFIAEYNA